MAHTSEQLPFSRVTYYVSVGVSAINPDRCGISVDTVKPVGHLMTRPNDSDIYVMYKLYTFDAAKKSVFSAIICNLRSNDIEPINGFYPGTNPDNRYYIGLHSGRFDDLIYIIERTLDGLCIGPRVTPNWNCVDISDEDRATAMAEAEKRMINLDLPLVVILNAGDKTPYTIHNFSPRIQTPESPIKGAFE